MDYQNVTRDNENSKELSKWFGLLAHFNKRMPIS
jgi:hypothetical protein